MPCNNARWTLVEPRWPRNNARWTLGEPRLPSNNACWCLIEISLNRTQRVSGTLRTERYLDVCAVRLDSAGNQLVAASRLGVRVRRLVAKRPVPGDLCLVAWSRDDAIVATRLSAIGAVLDQPPMPSPPTGLATRWSPSSPSRNQAISLVVWGEGGERGRRHVKPSGQLGPIERAVATFAWPFSGSRGAGDRQVLATTVSTEPRTVVLRNRSRR